METKLAVSKGELFARKWGFPNCDGMDCKGLSGGLLVMWDNNVKVKIVIKTKNQFWISCVYSHSVHAKKYKVWRDIFTFAKSIKEKEECISIGDFNQILLSEDKLSFNSNTIKRAKLLLDCINQCKLSEIPRKGQYMTWTNNREG